MSDRLGRLAMLGGVAVLLLGAAAADWLSARPDYRWAFPADHWSHPGYKTEWWYLTGHLTPVGDTVPRFGYQVTFFRVGLTPEPPRLESPWATADLVMGHVALTDRARGTHAFSEVLYRATPLLGGFGAAPDPLLAWSRAPAGTDDRWTLHWNGRAFDVHAADAVQGLALTLSTVPARPLVFQGPNGYSRKGPAPGNASQYYSFTRLTTTGRVVAGGDTLEVTGTSWMDKEFGSNQLADDQVGWDWFSLQLDDGRDVMLYVLRDTTGGTSYASGTLVSAGGAVRYLGRDAWTLTPRATWTSPRSGATYPSGWRLALPEAGIVLDVRPVLAAQENVSARIEGLRYWEGAVELFAPDGQRVGRGYVELTGYGRASRLPL